ncbi:MAG: serine hydrolase [Flavobacterium psychrophilum]|nr:MAG: serine hydrolase [Flavobacterium psychrophilum]
MKNKFSCLVISCFLLLSVFVAGQNKVALIDSLFTQAHRIGVFNGNVLVVETNKEIYRNAMGYADASRKIMLTDKYRFQIGSIAKEFNAVAIMMLQEQGKLKTDDKISLYLPDLPDWAKTVSIKNLLQYTSGIPNLDFGMIKSDTEARVAVRNITKLDFEAGTAYAYNNTNVFLQREIVAKVSGISFRDFVSQKMLKPLAMKSSLTDPDETTPLMAKAYDDNYIQSPLSPPFSGWTVVTLDDFYKWEKGLEAFKLIGVSSVKEILIPAVTNKQSGLGGGTIENGKIITHIHDGSNYKFQALLTANTLKGRTIILMTNNKQNNLYDINAAIENILEGKPFLQPKKPLQTALFNKIEGNSGKQLLEYYSFLKEKYPNDYDFSNESALNAFGYELLRSGRFDDAILIFEYNTKLFPQSGNVYDSLGEAYYSKGDKGNSLVNYKRAYELDPSNSGAKEKIDELSKK